MNRLFDRKVVLLLISCYRSSLNVYAREFLSKLGVRFEELVVLKGWLSLKTLDFFVKHYTLKTQ